MILVCHVVDRDSVNHRDARRDQIHGLTPVVADRWTAVDLLMMIDFISGVDDTGGGVGGAHHAPQVSRGRENDSKIVTFSRVMLLADRFQAHRNGRTIFSLGTAHIGAQLTSVS